MADRRDESSADTSTPDGRDTSHEAQQSEPVGRVVPSQQGVSSISTRIAATDRQALNARAQMSHPTGFLRMQKHKQALEQRTNMASSGSDSIFVTPGPEDLNLGSFNPRGMAGAARMGSDEADSSQRLEGQLPLPQPLPAPTRPPQGQVNMQQARQAPFQAHISPHPQQPAAAEHTPHLTPGHGRPVQMQAAPAQAARRRQTHRQTRRGSAPSQQAPDQEPIVIPDDGDPPLVTFRFNGAVATMPKTRVTRFVKAEGSKVFQSQAHHTLIDAHEAQFKDTALVISNPKTTKGYILQMYQSSWKSKLVRSCTAKRSYLHTVEGLKDQHAWDHERSSYQTTIVEPNVRILAQAERDLAKMDALIAFLRNN